MDIIRSRSPLRISFGGGGTDFHTWFDNGTPGAVMSSTINRYAYCTIIPTETKTIRIFSGTGKNIEYPLGDPPNYGTTGLDLAVCSINQFNTISTGFDMYIDSDALPGSGLGGSSALTSAMIGALAELVGRNMNVYDKAAMNYKIEREDLGIPGGLQDQYATHFGGFNFIEFYSMDKVLVHPLRLSNETIQDLESHLMFCYTGSVRTNLSLIDHQINACNESIDAQTGLENIHRIAHEVRDALLVGDVSKFGDLLHEGYMNKKKMNTRLTEGSNADLLYDIATEAGATGGKLCGAGGGGYLALYVPTEFQLQVKLALEQAGGRVDKISFESKGEQVWRSSCL